MTRKDYILIAAALKDARPYNGIPQAYTACDDAAKVLANALAQDNPRFERARFLKACGVAS